jgi:adenylate cyclase class 2
VVAARLALKRGSPKLASAMAVEIEKKYILDKKKLVELTAKLGELGAEFAYETFEENYLHRGGLLDFRPAVLRLRKTEQRTTLTYKEKLGNESAFKQQIEFETEISDVEAMENIIDRLGYKLALVYEKHRKSWHLGNVEVVLDELPFGYYMEIEGSKEDILKVEKRLGADDLVPEARGYPRLTLKFGKETKNGVIESRFAKKTAA